MAWRGACKPAHYNLDYSRFGAFDQDDDEEEPARANFMSKAMQNPNLPPELREAFFLAQVAKEDGDASKRERADELVRQAIRNGGPEIQKRFSESLDYMQQTPEYQQKAAELKMSMPTAEQFLAPGSSELGAGSSLKGRIEDKMRSTQGALQGLLAQQAKLEALASNPDPAAIEGFFKDQGWSEEDIARSLSDKDYATKLFSSQLPKGLMTGDDVEKDLAAAEAECEAVLDSIKEVAPKAKPKTKVAVKTAASSTASAAPAQRSRDSGEAVVASKPPRAETRPSASARVSRENGEAVVVVTFPAGVQSMAEVELDVAPGTLRVQGPAFAPLAVTLPKDVVTDGVQAAKFSKKRGELTVRLPTTQ